MEESSSALTAERRIHKLITYFSQTLLCLRDYQVICEQEEVAGEGEERIPQAAVNLWGRAEVELFPRGFGAAAVPEEAGRAGEVRGRPVWLASGEGPACTEEAAAACLVGMEEEAVEVLRTGGSAVAGRTPGVVGGLVVVWVAMEVDSRSPVVVED